MDQVQRALHKAERYLIALEEVLRSDKPISAGQALLCEEGARQARAQIDRALQECKMYEKRLYDAMNVGPQPLGKYRDIMGSGANAPDCSVACAPEQLRSTLDPGWPNH